MNQGRIEQVGSPRELYETPGQYLRRHLHRLAQMALIDVVRKAGQVTLGGADIALPPGPAGRRDGPMKLGVRPDALSLTREPTANAIPASVIYTEYLGENAFVYARLADGTLVGMRTLPNDLYEPDEP
jgi:lactose/L-arabinose transport system ATP-binding protein